MLIRRSKPVPSPDVLVRLEKILREYIRTTAVVHQLVRASLHLTCWPSAAKMVGEESAREPTARGALKSEE